MNRILHNNKSKNVLSLLSFILQIKLSEVDEVDILDKRGYLVVAITPSGREGKVYLRKTEGIRDWYQCLKVKINSNEDQTHFNAFLSM